MPTVAVLVLIVMGIGVASVVETQTGYGPSRDKFTTAFAGHVHQTKVRSKMLFLMSHRSRPLSPLRKGTGLRLH